MRSIFENKRLILAVSVLALGALTILAIGLRDIPFRAAQSFSRDEAGSPRSVPPIVINSVGDAPPWMQFSVWALLLLLVVLIGVLVSPELRKRLIRTVIRVAVTCWALYILFTRYPEILAQLALNPNAVQGAPGSASNSVPPPEFAPPQTVSMTSYLVSFGIAVLLVILARKLYSFWKENYAVNPGGDLHQIARIARSSLRDLSSGRDSTDVIMNCYFRMSDAVADKRQLQREAAMTPNEFASRLESAGLPGNAVWRLTRLFEHARYGGHRSGTSEVNEAVACLTTILHHCGEAV